MQPKEVGFTSLSCITANSCHQTGGPYVTIVHNDRFLPPNNLSFTSLSCIMAHSCQQTWFALCHCHTKRQVLTTKQGGLYVTIIHNGGFLPPNNLSFMSLSCITADSCHQTWFSLCHYHTGRQVLTTKQGGLYVTIVHNGRFLPPNKVGFMSLSCITADYCHQT